MTGPLTAAVESLGRSMAAKPAGLLDAMAARPCRHWPRREGDEYACGCGARWGVGETAPAGHHGP